MCPPMRAIACRAIILPGRRRLRRPRRCLWGRTIRTTISRASPLPGKPLIAPRVSTPVGESSVPDEVDYLIVGSGAGGATMAYRLACNAKSVLVIERGPRYSALQDFNDNELEMVRKLYKEGGLQQTKRFDLTILQGECVGGSTVINNAICFQMPDAVRNQWTNDFGLDLGGLNEEYDRDRRRIGDRPVGSDGRQYARGGGVPRRGRPATMPRIRTVRWSGRRSCRAISAMRWARDSIIWAIGMSESAPCWRRMFPGRRVMAPRRLGI